MVPPAMGLEKRASKLNSCLGLGIKLSVLSVHYLFIFQWMSVEYTKKNMGKKSRPLSLKRICQSIDVFWKERGNRKAWKNNVSHLDTIYHESDANPNSSPKATPTKNKGLSYCDCHLTIIVPPIKPWSSHSVVLFLVERASFVGLVQDFREKKKSESLQKTNTSPTIRRHS